MNINKISFKLICPLGSLKVLKKDLDNLQVGDILVLDSKIHKHLSIFINNQKSFAVSIGHVNNSKAVKVEKIYE